MIDELFQDNFRLSRRHVAVGRHNVDAGHVLASATLLGTLSLSNWNNANLKEAGAAVSERKQVCELQSRVSCEYMDLCTRKFDKHHR